MDQSERDDFDAALGRFGYPANDFKITVTDDTKYDPSGGVVPINEIVTVKRISTNKEKSYYSGQFSHWMVDFENDLRSGVFN